MLPQQSTTATLPKGFRYEDRDRDPRTPEPVTAGDPMEPEARQPSPPRPRLRLKRRIVSSHLTAPTQHFLASVAAADVPLPSVEGLDVATTDAQIFDQVPDIYLPDLPTDDDREMEGFRHLRPRNFSPPKTPADELAPSFMPTTFPNWSAGATWSSSDMESSPEYESSRPSTAFSTQSSASLFSHLSHASGSDDGGCISPEVDTADFAKDEVQRDEEPSRHGKSRKAPWTQAMSTHLWSTYLLYLQDPRVTPIRVGKSCVPPEGVCARVARQAKRSWKGSKAVGTKSGSSTPTAESSRPYIKWPHTSAASRAHLRDLCRMKASRPGRPPYLSQSPTPFGRPHQRRWNRRSAPARSPSVFSAQDLAISLATSTSDAMQPEGPLAQLTRSQREPTTEATGVEAATSVSENSPPPDRARLGSPPLIARSYGPSSSSTLAAGIQIRRQSQTVGPRKLLKSPVRLSRSGTQKRRSVKGLDDPPRKRPSLTAAFWAPLSTEHTDFDSGLNSEFADGPAEVVIDGRSAGLFFPLSPSADPFVSTGTSGPQDLAVSTSQPARLGSPFSCSSSSQSFPGRLSNPASFNLTALRRPFATVQQTSDSSAVEQTSTTRSSLASRLAYIDQRLKEFRSRGHIRRRSQSPI